METEIITKPQSNWLVAPDSPIEDRVSDLFETLRITGSISIAKRKAYVTEEEWNDLVDNYPSILKAVNKLEAEFEESMVLDVQSWRPEARLSYLEKIMPDRYSKSQNNEQLTDGQLIEVLVRIKA